jgi:stringent starvation protein B
MSKTVATSTRAYLLSKFNRRSVAFLLCLLLSGLFWLLMSLSEEYVNEISIPVVYNVPPEDVLVASELTSSVTAEVKGLGFDLMWYWLKFEQLEIPVATNPTELPSLNKNGVPIHYILTADKGVELAKMEDNQLTVLSVEPDTLFLKFVPKFIKQVPIQLNAEISFQKQFGMVSEPILIPDSILVIGAKEDVDTITFVVTEIQYWNDLNESLTNEVRLQKFTNLPFVTVSQENIDVEVNVVEFTEGSVTVPIQIVADNPESVKVFPHEVEIKYQVPLADYDKIRAEQFQVSVVLSENSLGQSSLLVNIDGKPQEVTQVRVSPAQVEFIVQK